MPAPAPAEPAPRYWATPASLRRADRVAQRLRRGLRVDRVEVDAGTELARGDVPPDTRGAPGRDDLHVQARPGPVAAVERALVDPQHVRRLRVEEAVESREDVHEQPGRTRAAPVAE